MRRGRDELCNDLSEFDAKLDKRLEEELSQPNLSLKKINKCLRNYMSIKHRCWQIGTQQAEIAASEPPSLDDEAMAMAREFVRLREEGHLTMSDLLLAKTIRQKSEMFGFPLPGFEGSEEETTVVKSCPALPLPALKRFIKECRDVEGLGNVSSPAAQQFCKIHSAGEVQAVIKDIELVLSNTLDMTTNITSRILRERLGIAKVLRTREALVDLLGRLIRERQKKSAAKCKS